MVKDLALAIGDGGGGSAVKAERAAAAAGNSLSSPSSPRHLIEPARMPFTAAAAAPSTAKVEEVGGAPMAAGFRHSLSAEKSRFKHPSASSSTLSTRSSPPGTTTNMNGKAAGESLFQRLTFELQHDDNVQREIARGKRVGFYRFKSELGSGNFSKVKLATHLLTKERVAVKVIDKTKLDAKTQKMVMREISIMDSLSHPSLIRLYEVSETLTSLHLVMEFASGGELFAKLTEDGPYSEDVARAVFAQIASAVEYMHDSYFIHRDLKAENVFFAGVQPGSNASASSSSFRSSRSKSPPTQPRDAPYPVVKVGDFGFATQVAKSDQHLNTFCGSPPYAAPELFQDDHYLGPSVDIWALGILLYFLVTGAIPFKGSTVAALKHAILDGKFNLPEYLSRDCCEVISGILRRKPEWRLTMAQLRGSRWLEGAPWPSPDTTYRPTPLTRERSRSGQRMTPHEERVRESLTRMGVTPDVVEEHAERGARSQVIGAYRILLHRDILTDVERRRNELRLSAHHGPARADTPLIMVTSPAIRHSRSLDSLRDRNGSVVTSGSSLLNTPIKQARKKKKKKSRFCVIL